MEEIHKSRSRSRAGSAESIREPKRELKLAVHYNKDIDDTDTYACKGSSYNTRPASRSSYRSNAAVNHSRQSIEPAKPYYPSDYNRESDLNE